MSMSTLREDGPPPGHLRTSTEPEPRPSTWGELIRERRTDLGLSGTATAKLAGLSQSAQSMAELDQQHSLGILRRLAPVLGLELVLRRVEDPCDCIPAVDPALADGAGMDTYTQLSQYTGSSSDRCLDAAYEAHGQLAGVLTDIGAGRWAEVVPRLVELSETTAQAVRLARLVAAAEAGK